MTTELTRRFGPGKYGICIDWETSGADFGAPVEQSAKKYQGITVGIIIFEMETFQPVEKLYLEIKFDETRYTWSDEAERIHGISREYLEANGVTREEAVVEILNLIVDYFGPKPTRVAFMGHNIDFDIAFFKQLLDDFDMAFEPFHVRMDTSSVAMALAGIFKSDDVFDLFSDKVREKHNALEDAELTLSSMRTMKQIFVKGLESE